MGVLIPEGNGCQPIEVPECNALFDMGESLLDAAYVGLQAFEFDDGSPCAGHLDRVISLGQPSADLCDVLFAWVVNYGATNRDVGRAEFAAGGSLISPSWQPTWQVELWESAYPTAEVPGGVQIKLPSTERLHEINRLVYAHGIAMYHSVLEDVVCGSLRLSQLMPLAPQGGCAGWMFQAAGPVPES